MLFHFYKTFSRCAALGIILAIIQAAAAETPSAPASVILTNAAQVISAVKARLRLVLDAG
jgi:anti-sigma factor ChrR (cupin superfamily)